jgi:serine/threonine-protein kinase RsbW
MHIELTLSLPRDAVSVPLTRHLAARALDELGVEEQCASDIEIALTEACTNVLEHVGEGHEYEVRLHISDHLCVIEVLDDGSGFDAAALGYRDAAQGAEGGRGIQLMRALVDRVNFTNREQEGTVVHLEKHLVLKENALIGDLERA